MKIIFKKDYVTVSYDPVCRWIRATWEGYLTEEKVREGCEVILKALEDNKSTKLLNDSLKVKGYLPGLAEWVANNWYPRASRVGLKAIASIVKPEEKHEVEVWLANEGLSVPVFPLCLQ